MGIDKYIQKAKKTLSTKNPFVIVSYIVAPYISKNQITLVSDAAKNALKEGDVYAKGLIGKLKDELEAELCIDSNDEIKVNYDGHLHGLPFEVRSKFPHGIAFLEKVCFRYERLEGFPELKHIIPTESGYAQLMKIALHRETYLYNTDIITLDFLTKTAGIKLKDASITKAWETELGKRWFEAAKKLGFEPSDNWADC